MRQHGPKYCLFIRIDVVDLHLYPAPESEGRLERARLLLSLNNVLSGSAFKRWCTARAAARTWSECCPRCDTFQYRDLGAAE